MTFQAGERLLYTGKYRDCMTGIIPKGTEVVVETTEAGGTLRGGQGKERYTYIRHATKGRWAVYDADLEAIAPAEPEEYEKWFV